MTEKPKASFSGLPVLIAAVLFLGFYFIASIDAKNEASIILGFPLLALVIFVMSGCYKLEPNQAAMLSFFGKYSGTVRDTGLRWNNPLYQKKKISLRVRNFESGRLKVNELDGSPIEIAAVIVWQVEGAAEAVYNVDDYESFVHIQSEAALRAMATSYPYDQHEEGQLALRSHAAEISAHLQSELTDRLADAGVAVLDARISHLRGTDRVARHDRQRIHHTGKLQRLHPLVDAHLLLATHHQVAIGQHVHHRHRDGAGKLVLVARCTLALEAVAGRGIQSQLAQLVEKLHAASFSTTIPSNRPHKRSLSERLSLTSVSVR